MSGADFAEIRARVSAEDVARYAGVIVKAHRCACPFHGGTHDNLSFHGGVFTCWVCGAKGSSLDFWSRFYGVDILSAARGINNAFSLGLDLDHRRQRLATPTERVAASIDRPQRFQSAFEAWSIWRYEQLLRGPESCFSLAENLRGGNFASSSGSCTQRRQGRQASRRLRRIGREFATLRAIRYDYADTQQERRAAALFAEARRQAREDATELRYGESPLCRRDAEILEKEFLLDE